jgi:hypothetical protein
MPSKQTTTETELTITAIRQGRVEFCLLGSSPLFFHRVGQKAQETLLLGGGGRKTKADKAQGLKHEPMKEYRESVYTNRGDERPTRLCFPAPGFKKAMGTAALVLPGMTKAEIGRLVWVEGYSIDIWGVPQLHMTPVRLLGMDRPLDIRTRAILPQWACRVEVRYVTPILKSQGIANLMGAAGMVSGIGDWRQEKGAGDHGRFEIVAPDHPQFQHIVQTGGREAQDAALQDPECYDEESRRLLTWFSAEVVKLGDARQAEEGAAPRRGRRKASAEDVWTKPGEEEAA